jgi:hypothetical protein
MFSAVLQGLDATPPLYTGYGWIMFHYVVPGASPELLLRITNGGLIGGTLWILYLLVRRYFGQMNALTTIGAFILLELWALKFLTLEMRTYAALVFFTALAIYAGVRALDRPSWVRLSCTMLAYCLLASSHIFGIIYAVSIISCTIVAAAAEGNIALACYSGLTGVPAVVMFFLWVPVLHNQAQLGNWIPRPDFRVLFDSTYPPANRLLLLAVLLLVAVLTLLWRRSQSHSGPTLTQWWQSMTRTQTFVLVLPVAFGTSTFAIWLLSRVVFPLFLHRYFFPNMILHTIWLSSLVDFVFSYLTSSKVKHGLALASAILAGLGIEYHKFGPEDRIPCFYPSRRAYLEDPFRDHGFIVALWVNPWLTRLNRPGEAIVYPMDERALRRNVPFDVFNYRFVSRFAEWSGVNAVMTTSELLDTKRGFMVLDDRRGSWLEYIKLTHKLKLTPLAETERCTLWKVEPLD